MLACAVDALLGAQGDKQGAPLVQGRLRTLEQGPRRAVKPISHFVGSLHALLERSTRMDEPVAHGGEESTVRAQARVAKIGDRCGVALHALQEFGAIGCGQFRGSGRCRRAAVGGEVGDGDIGLVTDRRNHGNPRRADASGYRLPVEGSEILKRAAATGDDDDVGSRPHALGAVERA